MPQRLGRITATHTPLTALRKHPITTRCKKPPIILQYIYQQVRNKKKRQIENLITFRCLYSCNTWKVPFNTYILLLYISKTSEFDSSSTHVTANFFGIIYAKYVCERKMRKHPFVVRKNKHD